MPLTKQMDILVGLRVQNFKVIRFIRVTFSKNAALNCIMFKSILTLVNISKSKLRSLIIKRYFQVIEFSIIVLYMYKNLIVVIKTRNVTSAINIVQVTFYFYTIYAFSYVNIKSTAFLGSLKIKIEFTEIISLSIRKNEQIIIVYPGF